MRQREDDDGGAIDRHRAEHDPPDPSARRPVGQDHGGDQRADAGRRAQQAEAPRAGMEHVAREHRQQRVDAAENDREQIERDDAEDDRVVPDVAEAGEQHGEADRLARGRVALDLHDADQHARREIERAAQRIDQDRAHRVEQSADRRPADHRDLRRPMRRPRWRATTATAARSPAAAWSAWSARKRAPSRSRTRRRAAIRASSSRRRCRSRASRSRARRSSGRCARSCAGRSGRRHGPRPARTARPG